MEAPWQSHELTCTSSTRLPSPAASALHRCFLTSRHYPTMDELGVDIQKEVRCVQTTALRLCSTCVQEPTFEAVVEEKTALLQELEAEEDLYIKYKKLARHLEMLDIQESYIKDEQANLKRELIRAQEEVTRIQSVPLVIGQFLEPIDQHTGIVGSTTGSNYVVRILSTLDRELLKPSSSVALHRHSNALVDILPPEADSSIAMLGKEERPDVAYQDIGGMDAQKQEIREAVELPLTHFDLYKKIGIDPPRGVLLYGPPGLSPLRLPISSLHIPVTLGTGKTMLVKAVAHHTTASFIRVVGSEFVQKYLGEGPRMVRDVFRLARENAPAIIFIDEIDAIATKRFDAQTGADREVQRILLELLNQMDGFDQGSNVKVRSVGLPFFSIEYTRPATVGHYGYKSSRHLGSSLASSWSTGSEDRVPFTVKERETPYFPDSNEQDEPGA